MGRIIIILLISLWVITNIIPLVNFLTEPPVLIMAVIYLSFLYLDKKKAYDNLLNDYNDLINKRRIANNG